MSGAESVWVRFVERSVFVVMLSLALDRAVALTIGVTSAASAAAAVVPASAGSAAEAVGVPFVGLDEVEGLIGEVCHGSDAVHLVYEVITAVKQDGDLIKIADSEAFIESGLPEIEDVITTFDRSEVPVEAVGHCRPKKVGFIHPVLKTDFARKTPKK